MTAFAHAVADFTATLRERHGFGVGHAQTRDALRASEHVGITDAGRVRRAMRAVYCGSPRDVERFDDAFDAFFLGRTREEPLRAPMQRAIPDARSARCAEAAPSAAADAWQTMRARYSAAAGRSPAPAIAPDGLDTMLAAADRLIAQVRLAPSRRRAPHRRGDRIDVRRTLRASVATAGEPIDLRRTRRARRTARFVVLIDGSRSNAGDAGPMLQFAFALVQRARGAHVFAFSTDLREITPALRDPHQAGRALDDLGEAWGGGTRIGASVLTFLREHGTRTLSASTIVLLFSDGLDAGELDRLDRALRELRTRSAAIVWLHPSAGARGFAPSSGGLRVALRYVRAVLPSGAPDDFRRLAARIARSTGAQAATGA